jgi:secreted PhoX family phosphatase
VPTLLTHAQAYETSEDVGRNASGNPTIGDIIAARFHRRDVLKGALGVAAIAAAVSPAAIAAAQTSAKGLSRFHFEELEAGTDADHHVAPGYDADVLIRWGDPVLPGAPAFEPQKFTAAAQTTATSSPTSRCRAPSIHRPTACSW